MGRDQTGARSPDHDGGGGGGEGRGSPGRRSLADKIYGARGQRKGKAAGEEAPTIHDAATAAVEHKDGGAPVDSGVATRVGSHLGADFSSVRVHQDPLAQEATAAMGARAFAYGGDVFLGPGESGGDLGLMAHELTHVVQQGAAGQRAPQRKVQVGDANSPAEAEADQVAGAVTSGTAKPATLLVDDGPVGPGQMLKSQFFDELRQSVRAAAMDELGMIYGAIGMPQIDRFLDQQAARPAAAAEAQLHRFAPAARAATTAAAMIPAVASRVGESVRVWRATGQPPADLAGVAPAAGGGGAPASAQALRGPGGEETLASLEADLGPGAALPGGTAARMSSALGVDVSGARLHTGATAARKAADAGAVAFAVGPHVVMGAAAPAAGTLEGDALLAHELAHTAQQRDAAADPMARLLPIGGEEAAAEEHADDAAAGAVAGLHGEKRGFAHLAARLGGAFRSGLQLQRCPQEAQQPQQQPQQQGGASTHVSNRITDGPYAWQQEFDVSFTEAEVRVVLKPKLAAGDGVTPEQLLDVKERAAASFTQKFDNKFVLTDTADNKRYVLRTEVQFVDNGEHYTINLLAGNGTSNRRKWYVERPSESFAHELGHQLGLKDEYEGEDSPDRELHTDHSIMGDIHGEGRDQAVMHQRHAETIAGEIGGATRRNFTVSRRR